jgi:hypothetical protein
MSAGAPGKPNGGHSLEGADRVAAILLTMGKSVAAKLMKHFEPEEIKLITRSVADLPPVQAPQLKALVEEFAVQLHQQGASADRCSDPVQGQVELRREGDQPSARPPARRRLSPHAGGQADCRRAAAAD